MKQLAATALLSVSSIAVGCAPGPSREAPPETGTASESAAPAPAQAGGATGGAVLGHIETRDRKMTIHASSTGPRFSVSDKQGNVIASGLTAEQLANSQPALHRVYKSSYAAMPIDARVDDTVSDPAPQIGSQPRRFDDRR